MLGVRACVVRPWCMCTYHCECVCGQQCAGVLRPLSACLLVGTQDSTMKVISEDSEVLCLALHCIYASLRCVQTVRLCR